MRTGQPIEQPDEATLLREARALMPPLAAFEPRVGFAAKVALTARDRRRPFAEWLRWSLGGLAMAGVAAVAVLAVAPRAAPQRHEDATLLAQRLDLYDDLDVVQHQQALEDLDIVEQLDLLQEGQP